MAIQIIVTSFIIIIGIIIIVKPMIVLYLGDITRLKGKREYTSYAIAMTRLFGCALIIVSIFALTDSYHDYTKKYEITFYIENDTTVYNQILIPNGESIDLTEYQPIKEGYVFIGWTEVNHFFVSNGFTVVECVEDIYIPTEDVELTAVFEVDAPE